MDLDSTDFGRIHVSTVPLPDGIQAPSATYTYAGSVLVLHRTAGPDEDRYALSVVADDGTGFRRIFEGDIPEHARANGIRHMPFADNRRVLLGDYILECSPDIDSCTRAELVPLEYPWDLEHDPLTSHHWSEIIVSPDDEHMAWTILRTDMGAAAAWGRLERRADRYTIEDATLISSASAFEPDPEHEGCVIPTPVRGGEVKQFVRGGTAISAVGSAGGFLPDSVIQSLDGDAFTPVTRAPGYDETTILSPDERLGIVMTSRASVETNPAVLGLLPRPLAGIAGRGASWAAYMYTVSGVRTFRRGNIGPVLIDIARSQAEPHYEGISLADPDGEWVYVSPLSWHPSGTRVMWIETLRGTMRPGAHATLRVRIAHLRDHVPSEPVAVRPAPAQIPYAITGEDAAAVLATPTPASFVGRVAGRHSGCASVELRSGDIATGREGFTRVDYDGFSDDGLTFYDGFEEITSSFAAGTRYRADLAATGEVDGEMRLRVTWSGISAGTRLLFDLGEDGNPRSFGFARAGSRRLDIADLSE
ncbi:hypothetical protein AAIB33_11635 [Microbacterium sp. AZCO]|uniref:hypothetical protein n=1 Tax=Microbacterium sp. AZCO TaxID=3142976 RepID=UPI0031F472E1